MSSASASIVQRKSPRFTFFDAERGAFRAQFTATNGTRSHPFLRKSDRGLVADEADVAPAMAEYCRKLIGARLLDPGSEVARLYLGDPSAEIIPMPLPPRAPPPRTDVARAKRSPAPGWHGMGVMSVEVDYKLIAELTPDGAAAKIMVSQGTPASKAGLRTGDYIVAVGRYGNEVSLAGFDALCLPAGTEILVRFHRPGRHRRGQVETALLKLRRGLGPSKPRWWQRTPRVAPGPEVARNDRSLFEAQMARHPHIKPLGFKILALLLRYYDGKNGAFPSYGRLASDVGSNRRQTAIEHVQALEWLGVVEIMVGAGRRGFGGVSNRFVIRWPDGWPSQKKGSAQARTT